MMNRLHAKRLQIRDYSARSLRGLSVCATRNIAFYCAAPTPSAQWFDDAKGEHLMFNISNRAMLLAELRRRTP